MAMLPIRCPSGLRLARKILGRTQIELADDLDLSRRCIQEMESGRLPIQLRTAQAIAWLLVSQGKLQISEADTLI